MQTDLSGALDTIALAVKELVHARHVVVLLMDVSKRTLWSSISTSSTGFAARLFRVKEGEGIIGACAADGAQVALCLAVSRTGLSCWAAALSRDFLSVQAARQQHGHHPATTTCVGCNLGSMHADVIL